MFGHRFAGVGQLSFFHEIALYALVICAYGALYVTGEMGTAPMAITAAGVFLSVWEVPERYRPGARFWNAMVILALLFSLFEWVFTEGGFVKGVVHFLAYVQIIQLMSRRTDKDNFYVYILSLGQMAASAILTISMSFFIFLILYTVIGTAALMLFTLKRDAASDSFSSYSMRLRPGFLYTAISASIFAFFCAMIIFFIMPRLGTGYFGWVLRSPKRVTGLGNNIDLGEMGDIKQDRATVMRVAIEGETEPRETLYWRGMALNYFDGKTWTTRPDSHTNIFPSGDGVFSLNKSGKGKIIKQEIFVEPISNAALLAADKPIRLSFHISRVDEFANIGRRLVIFLRAHPTDYWTLPTLDNITDRFNYTAWSEINEPSPEELTADNGADPENISALYLQIPELDRRIKGLAEKISAGKNSRYEKAVGVEKYLRDNYSYSLDAPERQPEDPLAEFLFNTKQGWCEYFATAMTILLRSMNIPARVVTGYQRGEWNDIDYFYRVRQSDAHSWVEVYFPNHGWILFDPTPSDSIAYRNKSGLLSRADVIIDAMRYRWNRWFVDYNFSDQVRVSIDIHDRGVRIGGAFYRNTSRAIDKIRGKVQIEYFAAIVILAISVIWWLRISFKNRNGVKAGSDYRYGGELRRIYLKTLKDFEKRGLGRKPSQTPLEHAGWVIQTGGEKFSDFEQLAAIFSENRYGLREIGAEELERAKEVCRIIKMNLN